MTMKSTAILWFRHDLRLLDNPALNAAFEQHGCVIPVYIHSPHEEAPWSAGEASQWWLYHSLHALQNALRKQYGLILQIRSGNAFDQLQSLIRESDAEAVYWNRRYESRLIRRDETIKKQLVEQGITAKVFNASLLFEPGQIMNQQGGPYKVFTAFYKKCQVQLPQARITSPANIPTTKPLRSHLNVENLALLSTQGWHDKFSGLWQPGEEAAQRQLLRFIDHHLAHYSEQRDQLANNVTSALSAHLHFGEISPRQIMTATGQLKLHHQEGLNLNTIDAFERQILWREFAYYLLFHFPDSVEQVFNQKYASFPWQSDHDVLRTWQRAETGIPLVDAGMRELWQTGTMHNRARMIVASFLTKNLKQHWLHGARWFWNTLLDADLANNTLGWQWVAGSGADAAPFYRIFNPIRQAERFDPEGEYVRRWIPELSRLPARYIHCPWQASTAMLAESGVKLSANYPAPVVDLAASRRQALDLYQDWNNNLKQIKPAHNDNVHANIAS